MTYCALDVQATHEVFQEQLPLFLKRWEVVENETQVRLLLSFSQKGKSLNSSIVIGLLIPWNSSAEMVLCIPYGQGGSWRSPQNREHFFLISCQSSSYPLRSTQIWTSSNAGTETNIPCKAFRFSMGLGHDKDLLWHPCSFPGPEQPSSPPKNAQSPPLFHPFPSSLLPGSVLPHLVRAAPVQVEACFHWPFHQLYWQWHCCSVVHSIFLTMHMPNPPVGARVGLDSS